MAPTDASPTDTHGQPSVAPVLALATLAGVAWGAHHLGVMTGGLDGSLGGRILTRAEHGGTVLLVIAGWFIGRPFAAARKAGEAAPRARTYLIGWVARAAGWWWLALAFTLATTTLFLGPRRLLAYTLFFRHPGEAGPHPALAIGALALPVALFALLAPLWDRWLRWTQVVLAEDEANEGWSWRGGLAGSWFYGLLWLGAVGFLATPYGPLSLLPTFLLALSVGFAYAHRSDRNPLHVVAVTLGSLVGLVLMPTGDRWWHAFASLLLSLMLATSLLALALSWRRAVHPVMRWLAVIAPGVVLMLQPAILLVARQHRERFVEVDGVARLVGPALPVFVWGLLLAAAIGAFGAWAIDRPLDRWSLGRVAAWRPQPFTAALGGVVGGAFVWRVFTWLTIAPERTDGGDPLFYHTAANLFAEGRGWPEPLNWIAFGDTIPSALHGPGYPLYLSIASRFGGTSYVDHKLASIVAGTAIVLLVGLVARRLAGPAAGVLAAAFAAIYPNLWIIDGVLFPEGLFAALTTLGILLAYRWRDRHRFLVALALGLSIGAAALVRGEGLFLAVILVLPWVMFDQRLPFATRVKHLTVVAVGTIAMVGPWTLYNVPRFETLVPLSTNGNELHVYSNCEDTYSGKFLGFWLFECQERIRRVEGEKRGDEAQRAVAWRQVGFDHARENLDQIPKVIAARVGRQWELYRPAQNVEFAGIEGRNTSAGRWGLAMYYGLAGPAVAGAVMLRRRGVRLLPLGAQVIGVTLTAAYAYGTVRFRAPAEPVLCILAAVALAPLLRRGWERLRIRYAPTNDVLPLDDDEAAFVLGGTRRNRRASLVALGVMATVIALPLRGLYRQPGSTMEEGFMLTFPERVLRGDIPNVDFLHLYGPGSLHVLAGVYRVFGVRLEVERTFGLLQHVAIIAAVYTLVRAWGRGPAIAAAILSTFLVLTPIGLSALAWNGGVALALWAVVFAMRRWWFLAGALAGLALAFRPDLVLALALAGGFLWWTNRHAWRPLLVGALVGSIPMWIHLLLAGPKASFEGMFMDPVFRLRPGRQLPRPPSWGHLDGALQVIGERTPPWWGLPHLPASAQLFIWFFLLPLVTLGVLIVAIWAHRRSNGSSRTRVLVAAALLAVGLLPQALQRPDSAHFSWVGCVSFPLMVPAIIEILARHRPTWHATVRWMAGVMVVAVTYLAVFPFYTARVYLAHTRASFGLVDSGLEVRRNDRIFYLGDPRSWLASQSVIADLDAALRPGQRLLVGPVDLRQTAYSDVFFYYLFPELVPATYYIEMDPGLANAEDSGLADEVASADWLILTRLWSGWIEANGSIVFGPDEPNQVVERLFCLEGSYEQDLIRLYRRCPGGGAPGPYAGPYDPSVDYAVEVSVPVPARPDGTHPPGSPAVP